MIIEPKIYIDAQGIVDALKHNQFEVTPRVEGVKLQDAPYYIQDFNFHKQHIEYCSKLLKAAEYNNLTLLTSSLSIAEVWHLGKNAKPPSEEDKRIIMSVLSSGRIIKIVTDSIFIAEKARDLSWKYGIELTGNDAIHVATALEANCIEFITNDKGILGQKEKIKKLGLNVINAHHTSGLPANFYHPLYDGSGNESEEFDEVLNESEFYEEEEDSEELAVKPENETEIEIQEKPEVETTEIEMAQNNEKDDTTNE